MHFHISRNGQTYGPYTLADLRRYVTAGNIALTDLTKSESMSEWVAVEQVLHDGGEPARPAQSIEAAPPSVKSDSQQPVSWLDRVRRIIARD